MRKIRKGVVSQMPKNRPMRRKTCSKTAKNESLRRKKGRRKVSGKNDGNAENLRIRKTIKVYIPTIML